MQKGLPLPRWSANDYASFHSIKSDTLLDVDYAATGVLIKNSKIMHLGAGSGEFASKQSG